MAELPLFAQQLFSITSEKVTVDANQKGQLGVLSNFLVNGKSVNAGGISRYHLLGQSVNPGAPFEFSEEVYNTLGTGVEIVSGENEGTCFQLNLPGIYNIGYGGTFTTAAQIGLVAGSDVDALVLLPFTLRGSNVASTLLSGHTSLLVDTVPYIIGVAAITSGLTVDTFTGESPVYATLVRCQ